MSRHPQVRVRSPLPGPARISVDEEMAPLLAEVWRLGLLTWASCQDWGDGTAQIVFVFAEDAHRFAWLGVGEETPAGWRFKESPNPWGRPEPMCAVWFPRELLAKVRRSA